MVIRRMAFETQGYLKQTNRDRSELTVPQEPKLSEELRHALLSIPGVYGLGTIYGQLEIHVDKDIVKDSADTMTAPNKARDDNDGASKRSSGETTYSKQSSDGVESCEQTIYLSKLKSDIALELQKNHFNGQHTVKYILKKPEEMAASYEPGDKLLRRDNGTYVFGTLGAFIVTKDEKLHGLTCGHVVGENKKIFIDKGGPEPFSKCPKIVKTGNGELKYIDVAVLEVLPLLQKECKRSLERSVGRITTAKISNDHPASLNGKIVYKYGAATGETKGFVVSDDYVYKGFDEEAKEYLVMIDIVPNVPDDYTYDFSPITRQNDICPSKSTDQDRNNAGMEVVSGDQSDTTKHFGSPKTETGALPSEMIKHSTTSPTSKVQDVPNGMTGDVSPTTTQNYKHNPSQLFEQDGSSIAMEIDEATLKGTPIYGTASNEPEETSIGIIYNRCSNIGNCDSITLESGCPTSGKVRLKDKQSRFDSPWLEVCGSNDVNGNCLVYIRDVQSVSSELGEPETPCSVFAQGGDSGSVVCTPDVSHNSFTYLAVSMLSAGDFKVEGNEGPKCLSFKLNVALEKLKQEYALDI